jgi:hypothetical protein
MSEINNQQQPVAKNPLANWFRQPKIYVKLPSQGKFYPPGTLDVSSNEEYPVYAMTAKDELMFKSPDALLSGQSSVEVIKSCIPAIKDPWMMPSIDVDFALIAIRVATYGDKMEIGTKCPGCETENDYDVNLTNWLGMFSQFVYNDTVVIDPLIINLRPYTYKELSRTQIKTLEQQKIFAIINDEKMDDEQKVEQFGKSFIKITELTVDVISDCISKIETPNGATTDKKQIKEFINNCSKDVFDRISDHLKIMKEQIELKAQHVHCEECGQDYEVPVTMDQSNFFDVKS